MDVSSSVALPQSMEHFHLLLFMFNMLMVLLLPYLALVVGSTAVALWAERKGRTTDEELSRGARVLIDLPTSRKSLFLFFAVVPTLALTFIFAQILQGTPSIAPMAMLLGFLCLTAAGVALYTYRFTYDLQPLLHSTGAPVPPPDIAGWRGRNDDLHRRSGRFALTFLLLGCFLVMGAIAGVINPSTWVALDTLPALVIAPAVWLKLAGFLSVSLALTGAGILITLSGPRGESTALHNVLHPLALRLLATGILIAPLFLIGEIVLLPSIAVSGDLFGIAAGVVLLLFIALHFVYALARHPRPGAHVYVALVLLATTTLLATKDQIILHHATREHATILARAYATDEAKLRASFGIVAATQSGEDIYNAKCSACHLFDQKKVGPPYKEVLVKYAGKKSELVAFILNPVKVNPAYPPMPNQGLKAAEADSIARYLLEKSGPGGS